MSKIIFKPAVFKFSHLSLDWEEIKEWMEYNGYNDASTFKVLNELILNVADGKVTSYDALCELCARFCYRAFRTGRPTAEHLQNIIESGHGSVLAHANITLSIQGVSRTLTHELVRHHVGVNPSQESQRYVDAKDMNFVVPPLLEWAWKHNAKKLSLSYPKDDQQDRFFNEQAERWLEQQQRHVRDYIEEQEFLTHVLTKANPFEDGEKLKKRINEASRCHLPGDSETRLTWTMNLRAARDILGNPAKRGGEGADLEIRRLALEMLKKVQKAAPFVFADFEEVSMPVINGIKSKFGGV